jgi:hypothetical protein
MQNRGTSIGIVSAADVQEAAETEAFSGGKSPRAAPDRPGLIAHCQGELCGRSDVVQTAGTTHPSEFAAGRICQRETPPITGPIFGVLP